MRKSLPLKILKNKGPERAGERTAPGFVNQSDQFID